MNQLCFGLAVWVRFPPDFSLNRQIDASGKKLALLVQVLGTLGKVIKTWQCGRSLFCFGMHACRYIHHFGKRKHITFSKQPVNMDCLSVLVCSFGRAQEFLLCFSLCKMFYKTPKDHLQSNVPPAKRLRSNLADLFLSNNVSAQRTEEIFEDANLAGAAFCSDIGHPDSVAADPEKKKKTKMLTEIC